MQMIKGAAAGLVALIVCPCHLPVTLPVILLMTSGTAVGAWLAANQWSIWITSIVLFAGGLALAILWIGRAGTEDRCEVTPKPSGRTAGTAVSAEARTANLELANQSKEGSHV